MYVSKPSSVIRASSSRLESTVELIRTKGKRAENQTQSRDRKCVWGLNDQPRWRARIEDAQLTLSNRSFFFKKKKIYSNLMRVVIVGLVKSCVFSSAQNWWGRR